MSDNDHSLYSLDSILEELQEAGNDNISKERKESSFFFCLALIICFCLILFLANFPLIWPLCLLLLIGGSALDVHRDKMNDRASINMPKLRDAKEFYREEFRYEMALDEVMSEENRKYQEVVDRQNKNRKKVESINYSKEDEINLLVEGIEDYFYCYNLPALQVKDYEWDVFFDTLFDEFKRRGIRSKYFHGVSEIIRYTLSNILISGKDVVRIDDFIDNLEYLCGTYDIYGIFPETFNCEDVDDIQSKMILRIDKKSKMSKNNKRKVL